METTSSSTETVDKLNSFLRGEISAVETYRQAIDKLAGDRRRPILEQCQRSHEYRVQMLRQEIRRRGGTPAESSGTWGAFAKLIEGGAKLFGERAAISALEEGEDHGRDDYKRDLKDLDSDGRGFVEQNLIPEQMRTHQALSALKHAEGN
jgi:demethoxyubiquinone hydroxylase (CLK1/Coq7/Cat5 family)